MAFALCPSCDEQVRISGRPEIGMEVTCPSCGDELVVVELNPIELDWIYYDDDDDEEEDWDDEDF